MTSFQDLPILALGYSSLVAPKAFFQTGKEFMNSFSGVTFEKYHIFYFYSSCLVGSLNYAFYRFD